MSYLRYKITSSHLAQAETTFKHYEKTVSAEDSK